MEAIKFENLSFKYPKKNNFALEEVSFSVNESDFVVLCGESGCGKSTLLKHIKKNLLPFGERTGEVLYYNQEISKLDDRTNASQIGFVRQDPDNQIVTDKVWHELAFILESLGYETNEIKRKVAEMASFFGIQTWFNKNTCELSGGQKQLLNLASVMVMQPKVLILDEPTAQLDPIAASEFINTLKNINEEFGTTIIISEHRLEELFQIANKIIVMDNTKVDIYDTPKNVALFLYDNGCKKPMFNALPAAMQIYAECSGGEDYPLTIKDGRNWIKGIIEKDHTDININCNEENNSDNSNDHEAIEKAISLNNLYFKYEKTAPYVLNKLNLKVNKGEILAILGGNGTGKSTMLKAICKVIKPQDGKIYVNGKDIKKQGEELFKKNLAMLPQNPQSIFTEATCQAELMEALHYEDITKEEKEKLVHEISELLNLENLKHFNPYDLSGGEQQRLALGKILLLQPKVLLLDEPTKGIDAFFKKELGKLLWELRDKGITVLLVSHDIEFCARYANRCGLFFDGEIISISNPKDFFAGNNFYTTSANKLVREWNNKAILNEEVSSWIKTLI